MTRSTLNLHVRSGLEGTKCRLRRYRNCRGAYIHPGDWHFIPHLSVYSGSGAIARYVVWGAIYPQPVHGTRCLKSVHGMRV